MAGKQFACLETGCTEQVEYEPEIVVGLAEGEVNVADSEANIVYLTCPKGHVHPYNVKQS